VLLDVGFCSLAQEMSFVDCYLPYFRQQLITHPPFWLSSLFLLKVYMKISSLLLPLSLVHFQQLCPSAVC
jgi:hypothetical protein